MKIITCVASPSCQVTSKIVTGNRDSVSVWDLQTRQRVKQFTVPDGSLSSIALSPDGKTLVTGSDGPQAVRVRLGIWPAASRWQSSMTLPA